jgi:hypothetical protein
VAEGQPLNARPRLEKNEAHVARILALQIRLPALKAVTVLGELGGIRFHQQVTGEHLPGESCVQLPAAEKSDGKGKTGENAVTAGVGQPVWLKPAENKQIPLPNHTLLLAQLITERSPLHEVHLDFTMAVRSFHRLGTLVFDENAKRLEPVWVAIVFHGT